MLEHRLLPGAHSDHLAALRSNGHFSGCLEKQLQAELDVPRPAGTNHGVARIGSRCSVTEFSVRPAGRVRAREREGGRIKEIEKLRPDSRPSQTRTLEYEFQHELHLTWCAQTHWSCVKRQIYLAEVGSRNQAIRASIHRPVEEVENFGAEINL